MEPRRRGHDRIVIVDSAVYDDGRRLAETDPLEGARRAGRGGTRFVWVGLLEPTAEEFEAVRAEFDLHELAVEDAVKAHQRPKLEVYGDTLFLVIKTVVYQGDDEAVEIGEVMIFVGPDFLITVRHGSGGGLGDVRERLEERPDLLRCGPSAALHALVDRIVDAYLPALAGLEEDVDQVEDDVFSPERTSPVERIYNLRREVIEFLHATDPLRPALERLASADLPNVADEIRPYFRDVADHAARVVDQLAGLRELLASILQASLGQIGVRQNEDMRRISAWVAIIAVPTMIAGIYGMNFEHMPELKWTFGYPLAIGVMIGICSLLYVRFKKSGWL